MPQAVEVETQSEQESLARLHPERATGRASRELALYRREQCFDQGAAPVEPSRERPPHLGFAKSPVLVAHQTQDDQQLRLRELVLAEASPIGWEHRPTHFQGGAGKCQESNFRHRACCLRANGPSQGLAHSNSPWLE